MSNRILICDDQAYITRIVELSLRKEGFEIETYPNGLLAWEAIQRDPPLMVISDSEMPLMNGLELCREIRKQEELEKLPIILLTARAFQLATSVLKEELNISAIVKKPFSPRELRHKVKTITASMVLNNESA